MATTYPSRDVFYGAVMTPELAKKIRAWRCHEWGATYRQIAALAYNELEGQRDPQWNDVWSLWGSLPSNQTYGMDLCEFAAKHFGEDPDAEPWN